MTVSRRAFLAAAASAALVPGASAAASHGAVTVAPPGTGRGPRPADLSRSPAGPPGQTASPADRFDPWLEVEAAALHHNVDVVSDLTSGRPILAVVKNNAYGLGLVEVARVLEPRTEVAGFAVVKADAALALRAAGVTKPVLLMGLFGDEDGAELVRRGVHLALTTDDGPDRVRRAEAAAGGAARTHLYLDTGLGRMGVPWHRALPWMESVARSGVSVDGTFMAFTEDPDFDPEQLGRFLDVTRRAGSADVTTGSLHAASSNAVFHLPDAHLDLVRPGIALFGAYPSDWQAERAMATLRPAVRLRARVVRVERLRPGDGVSYGRNYVAERPTWTATLPAGHTDGVFRQAVEGQRVLVGDRLYPVIGAVSASHSVIEVGDEPTVSVGDVATFLGPDRPELHPNAIAAATGRSAYDALMHLSPSLPRFVL